MICSLWERQLNGTSERSTSDVPVAGERSGTYLNTESVKSEPSLGLGITPASIAKEKAGITL